MPDILRGFDATRTGRALINRAISPRGVYDNFGDAWDAARRLKHAGHNHESNVTMHLGLSESPRPSDHTVILLLSKILGESPKPLRVFDFGGNAGNLFYLYRRYLPANSLDWTVYDIPEIVDRGRALAARRHETALHFTGDLRLPADTRVLLASGSLHYWEDSIARWFAALGHRPRHVIINRSPLCAGRAPFCTVQVTEQFCVPCLVRNVDELIAHFAREGYRLADRWKAAELSIAFPLRPHYEVPAYTGLHFMLAA